MVISILGCGWYGKALALSLLQHGFGVKGSATSADKLIALAGLGVDPFLVDIRADGENVDPAFFDCDILVISIPPKTRRGGGGEYLPKLERIIKYIVRHQIGKVIYISSTAVYEEGNREVTENNEPTPNDENGAILLQAEQMFSDQPAFSTTVIRFAGLVGPGRHPGRFFAGKKNIPNGLAPVNLIHLDDCVAITMSVISQNKFGYVLNASSPDHPAKTVFYTKAALQGGFAAPDFIPELAGWKVVNSVLLDSLLRYQFKAPLWEDYIFA